MSRPARRVLLPRVVSHCHSERSRGISNSLPPCVDQAERQAPRLRLEKFFESIGSVPATIAQGRFGHHDLHSCPKYTGSRQSQPVGLWNADTEAVLRARLDGKFSS